MIFFFAFYLKHNYNLYKKNIIVKSKVYLNFFKINKNKILNFLN